MSSFHKTKLAQTSRSVFADRIKQTKKTELKLELIKFVDCFLDGHGNHTSNLVSFKIKTLLTNHWLNSKEFSINQVVVQMILSSHPLRTQLPQGSQ